MSKFERVLSSEEITNIVFPCDWSENKDQQAACIIAREIEHAVLAKLAEQENVPFTPKTVSEMRSFIGMNFDSLQYANPETKEPDEMDRYTLTIHDLLSAFSWAGHYDCDHTPDTSKIAVPEGWQLVPKEPNRDMLKKMFYEIFDMDGIEEEHLAARYRNMLSSFPKYTGVIND